MQAEKIIKIKKIGNIPTLDITVNNKHHLFYANNIVTSNSHSYGYAIMSYHTAIAKYHFPLRFYKSWLNHAYDKIKPLDEIRNLVLDAKAFNVDVLNPDLRLKNKEFVEKDGRLYFGLEYIKEVGESAVTALIRLIDALDLNNTSWTTLLFRTLINVNQTAIKRLVATGALDYYKLSREQMLFEHDVALKLTKKEIEWIISNLDLTKYNTIEPIFKEILTLEPGKGKPLANKNRKNIIKSLYNTIINPPYSIKIDIGRNIALERSFLGIELSAHKHDLIEENISDCTIKEFIDGAKFEMMKFLVEIDQIKTILTKKKKQEMSFVSASDATGQINDIILFPEAHANYSHLLSEGDSVIIIGKRGERDNLVVHSVKVVD